MSRAATVECPSCASDAAERTPKGLITCPDCDYFGHENHVRCGNAARIAKRIVASDSTERGTVLDKCPKCKAERGEPCRRPNGREMAGGHAERMVIVKPDDPETR